MAHFCAFEFESKNCTTLVNYSYLVDGTKLSALKDSGEGLVYRGPFVYRKSAGPGNSSLTLESAAFGGGRLTPSRAMLYVTDYLGSVRAVVDGQSGELYKASDYSAFGEENDVVVPQHGIIPTTQLATAILPDGTTIRDSYTGKEDQSLDFGTGYIDFGARQYNPSLRRWMTPDPLSEKYYGISPYVFCNNNPVNLVDPDGQSPIYNISGHLIGTDDEGLQGDAIIMNDDDFSQGMSHSDAISHNLGKEGLSNQSAIYNFETSYASLCQRPDWDGQLTLDEAKSWYNNGIGLPLYVDSSKIDLGNFSISDLDGKNSGYYNTCTLVPTARNSFKIPESGLVYGNILVTNIGEGYVFLGNPESRYLDTYDFDIKGENIFRDLFTALGDWYNGNGIKYNIYTYGKKKVSNN